MHTRMTARVAAGATLGLAVFAAWTLLGWGGPRATTIATDVGAVVGGTFAVGCAAMNARRFHARQRMTWACLAVGVTGRVVGNVLLTYSDAVGSSAPRAVSLLDFCYLALPVGACVAAVFAPTAPTRRFGMRLVLDGLIISTSLFMVVWSLFLRALAESTKVSGVALTTGVAYPFADLVAVTVGVLLVTSSRREYRSAPALITAGLVVIAVSDGAYLYSVASGLGVSDVPTLGWATGMYLIGLGGLATLRRAPAPRSEAPRSPSGWAVWLPYVPVPFAFAVASRDLWPTSRAAPLLLAGVALGTAALARQFLLLFENRQLLAAVTDMALRDPLTGLANRALFADRLAHAMQLRERTGAPVAVLLADLDDFKLVNDSMGHPVGDELLRSVGQRIQNTIRPGDTVARIGGDEFAILVEDAPAIAEQIVERVVRSFDEPFELAGRVVYMGPSIGLATAVGNADVSADELFKRADLAMYSAKRAHVGARSFTPDMRQDATEMNLPSQQEKTGRRGGVVRIQFLGDLRRAIDERELDLVYQPKIDLATGKAVGVEALIRWPHPEFGLLEPADFLPLVRENGLMEAVTDLVLERAIEDAASWQESASHLPVAINLSAPSLNDESLPARVLSGLARHGMSPVSLTVEITEDLLLASVVRARSVLDQLRASGIRVAIDDFGSGYAAMTYLHELPIDELKLDRQFVAPILHDERAAAIVRSVIELAHQFGLTSVAEGVEDKATADLLRSFGCGFAQGHYFSMPVPAEAIRLGLWGAPSGDGPVEPSETTRSFLA
jgi:diguanylate cyclase (GGDEF)-like protein